MVNKSCTCLAYGCSAQQIYFMSILAKGYEVPAKGYKVPAKGCMVSAKGFKILPQMHVYNIDTKMLS